MHCKKPTEEVLMWILTYADDISLACDIAEKLREAVTTMDATFLRWGLTISTKKTKVLVVGRNAAAQAAESVITLQGDQLEVVSQFKYLGSVFTSDCTLDAEITHRVAAANSAFQHFRRASIWIFSALTLSFEVQSFQCIVMSVLLCSGETWAVVKQHISPWAVFHTNCLRRTCGISLRDHVPNVDILRRCNTLSQLQGKRLRWLGYVVRMPNDIECLRSVCLVNSRGLAHLSALGLVSMMLRRVIVKTVKLVDRIEMRKTDGFGKTRLVLHVPSSS